MDVGAFSYDLNTAPPGYRCGKCDLRGVKLWRESHSSHVDLRCAACAGATDDLADSDQIGGHVPAVPDEDGASWWGYASAPHPGCEWWERLPCAVAVLPGRASMTAAEARAVDAKFAATKAKRRADEQATIDDMIASTVVAVEATSYESMALWREWNDPRDRRPKMQWDHISLGAWFQIGKFHDAPVCVSLSFARVNGSIVAFWECTSIVAHSEMIEAWIAEQMPKAEKTNAMNFHPPGT